MFRSLTLSVALGLLSALAFQPGGWWPLMILAIAGLAEMAQRAPSLRRSLLIGWGFGLGQFVLGLNWIATAFTFQAAMPAWLGWVAVVLLSLYLAVYPMLAAGMAWKIGRDRPVALVLALAGAWVIGELLRSIVFTGFPWNPAAAAMAGTPLITTTRWIGTYGLSGLVVLLGGALWLLVRQREWKWPVGIAALVALLVLLPPPRQTHSASGNGDGAVPRPIRIVQPNIGQDVKWDPQFEARAMRRLEGLSAPDASKPELIFWPEAAVTTPLSDTRPGAEIYVEETRRDATRVVTHNDLLLTGGVSLRSDNGRTVDRAANSIFILGTGGQFVGRYDKGHLVPYGEYLPMRPILSAIGLSRLAPGDGDFQAGSGPGTLGLPGGWGKAGFQVCYEMIFSGNVVDRANRPDFIFNPSNDAWFGRWGPPQHLAQAQLRAAEEGLPVVRSTPTGISALIDADGAVVASIPWRTAGVIDTTLPDPRQPTLFARLGNVIPVLLGLLFIAGAIALGRRRG
nr:apolipoprotein N-acyltransferase [uncultured Sphingomonas sp.]